MMGMKMGNFMLHLILKGGHERRRKRKRRIMTRRKIQRSRR
jgi:hypothetical protein